MGTLRSKMIDAMKLRRFSLRTQESYLGAVSALAKYYNLPPDQLDANKIQAYLLHLTVEGGLSWSSCNVAVSAFRFFYVQVLGWEHVNLPIPPRKKPTKLPGGLSRQELDRLFACAHPPRNRMLLMTTYAAGLRVSEVTSLKVSDIDSHRRMIRIEQAKGNRDRSSNLSERMLERLRLYWKLYQPRIWLFPSSRDPNRKMDIGMAQKIYYVAKHRFVSEGEKVEGRIGFDMYGAEFTHQGEDCTFETMIKQFGLVGDAGLQAIAEIVHDIDLKDNKFNRLEASGPASPSGVWPVCSRMTTSSFSSVTPSSTGCMNC
jgi:integrase/recombinase XerD